MRWLLGILAMAGGVSFASAAPAPKESDLITALIENLDDPDIEIRQNIAAALANLGDAAVPALLDALAHPKAERRMGAAVAIARIRPPARTVVPALLQAMKDKDEAVRRYVSYALSRIVGHDDPSGKPGSDRQPNVPPPEPTPTTIGANR